MIKKLFIYWDIGFKNSDKMIQKCLISWKINNPDWEIIELDKNNLINYIDIKKEIPDIENKTITQTSYSDIIRIFLLEKYGGLWCDATTFCNYPLNDWLFNYIESGFFAFELNSDRMNSSWFLYADKNNYIIKKWKEAVINHVNNIKKLGINKGGGISIKIWKNNKYNYEHYFWFHYLFVDLYNNDEKFKKIWDLTNKISADGPHLLQKYGLVKEPSQEIKDHINTKKSPLYKLTYKFDKEKLTYKSTYNFLLNKANLRFLHIPKTAGTSIEEAAFQNNIKWGKFDNILKKPINNITPWHTPQKINCYSFCVLRCPFERIISQFYHENNVEDYNKENLNIFLKEKLKKFKNNINMNDNHFLPQIEFFKYSNIILSFDNIQENINKLTDLFYLPKLNLSKLPGGIKNQNKRKNIIFKRLTKQDISNENIYLIKKIYFLDFYLYNKVRSKGIYFNNINNMNNIQKYLNIKFIHIGKCSGTFISNNFNIQTYHHNKNYKDNENYIIWVRNPIKRFVSAFWFSYNLINLDTSNLDINNLTLKNCLAPERIKFKMLNDYTFDKRYDYLINYFKNPNKLAESLSSEDINDRKLGYELMNYKLEHIHLGIGWYLNNGDFIKNNLNKILFVGSTENINDDIFYYNLSFKNSINNNFQRKNFNTNDKYLSQTAIKNIINFYKETDYKALKVLLEYNFINEELYNSYFTY